MNNNSDRLKIGNKYFQSRLLVGTGKYKNSIATMDSIDGSGSEIVTVAIRRLSPYLNSDNTNFLEHLDWEKIWLLPNTAGSQTAEEAIRMAFFRP